MTAWYSPPQLLRTGIRVAISTVFGEFSDKREAIAAGNPLDPSALDPAYRYSERAGPDGAFWIDYLADTGDGWDATYAMARLLDGQTLNIDGQTLPRGSVLVMGGDQVYPTASADAYQARLREPFNAAARDVMNTHGDVYLLPGNHDWYDGLNAFIGIFCRRRPDAPLSPARDGARLGDRSTQQTRSYFALKLPGGWWLWGADIQLSDFIDQPQLDFFNHVAQNWMAPRPQKVILCTGKPGWEYARAGKVDQSFAGYAHLERIALTHGHQVPLTLSGDSHHYARYTEGARHYVTCGGGGAFTHPTHHLPARIEFEDRTTDPTSTNFMRSFVLANHQGAESLYPPRSTSFWATFRNLGFAALNWQFTLTLFAAFLLFDWAVFAGSGGLGLGSLAATIAADGLWKAAAAWHDWLPRIGPAPLVMLSLWGLAWVYFADARRWSARIAIGSLHLVFHVAVLIAGTIAALSIDGLDLMLRVVIGAALAALGSSTLMGVYLLVMLNGIHRHWNEAFSSLRLTSHKCFLRIAVHADGRLTLYAIGLRRLPKRGAEAAPELIETVIID